MRRIHKTRSSHHSRELDIKDQACKEVRAVEKLHISAKFIKSKLFWNKTFFLSFVHYIRNLCFRFYVAHSLVLPIKSVIYDCRLFHAQNIIRIIVHQEPLKRTRFPNSLKQEIANVKEQRGDQTPDDDGDQWNDLRILSHPQNLFITSRKGFFYSFNDNGNWCFALPSTHNR